MTEKAKRVSSHSRNVHHTRERRPNATSKLLQLAKLLMIDETRQFEGVDQIRMLMNRKEVMPASHNKDEHRDVEDNEVETVSLRKRRQPFKPVENQSPNPSNLSGAMSTIDANLLAKVQTFKRSMNGKADGSNEVLTVKQQADLLHKLLRFLCTYHSIKMSDLIEMLDESKGLNMEKLRLKLCNQTVVQRVG